MTTDQHATISETQFVKSALEFLSSRIGGDAMDIGATTELIDSGILDSLLILEFFLFLEGVRGSGIDPDGFDVASLSTLHNAYQLVTT